MEQLSQRQYKRQGIERDLRMRDVIVRYLGARKPEYLAALLSVSTNTIRNTFNGTGGKSLLNCERDQVNKAMIEAQGMKPLRGHYTYVAIARRWQVSKQTVIRHQYS